jgi:hypothetical protein
MGYILTGDQLRAISRKLGDLHRQLGQKEFPHDPEKLLASLQAVDEGKYERAGDDKYVIRCGGKPFIPEGWSIVEADQLARSRSVRMMRFEWSSALVELYLSEGQKDGRCVNGLELRKELEDKPVLNACVLDHLLAYPELIPESWGGKAVFFWGTVYRDADDNLCARYLYWGGGSWRWSCNWPGYNWHGNDPAALLAT